MILPVVKIPAKNLFTPSKKVVKFDQKLHRLVRDMKNTLIAAHDPEGVGLAAVQVGINIRLFIIRPKKREKIKIFINPEILKIESGTKSKTENKQKVETKTTLEGCLSVDKIWSEISRPQKIHLKYQTIDEAMHEEWFEGFEAVIVQHEVDHLDGILFTRRALEQNTTLFEEKRGKLHKIEL